MRRKAYSPYTTLAVGFVERNPGCSKWELASFLARRCCPSRLYRLVNTQIRLGNIRAERSGRSYQLYVTR